MGQGVSFHPPTVSRASVREAAAAPLAMLVVSGALVAAGVAQAKACGGVDRSGICCTGSGVRGKATKGHLIWGSRKKKEKGKICFSGLL